jgi:hypothetical protein
MTDHTAQAEFVITSWEEDPVVADAAGSVSRTRVVKQFSGDIAGTSEAWLVMSVVDDSHMAYCGAERFDVTLDGRAGGFVLLHDAVNDGASGHARWVVQGGSGTGDLTGLAGTAEIDRREDGGHGFTLHYALA